MLGRYIEIEDDRACLTDAERAALDAVVRASGQGPPRLSMSLRAFVSTYLGHGVGETTLRRWYRGLQAGRLLVPTPPPLRHWQVWHLSEGKWKYARIAAGTGSPATAPHVEGVAPSLNGHDDATRETQAKIAVKRVRAFRAECERTGQSWWFTFCAAQARLFYWPDPPHFVTGDS